jgi:hypothetical protein
VPKAVTIQGVGMDDTTIVDNIDELNGGGQVLNVTTHPGERFRLTGMTFRGMSQNTQVSNLGTILLRGGIGVV